MAFVLTLLVIAGIVLGVWWFTGTSPTTILAYTVIFINLGILLWFFQSPFRHRKTVRNTLLVYSGGWTLCMVSALLFEVSKTISLILLVTGLAGMRFVGRPMAKQLQGEVRQEESKAKSA